MMVKKDLFKEFQEFVKLEYGYKIENSENEVSFALGELFSDFSEDFFYDYDYPVSNQGVMFYNIVNRDSKMSFEDGLYVSDNEWGFDELNLAA